MKITIGHLYPDLLNLYGDVGNIRTLSCRLQWRGIDVEVREYRLHDEIDFSSLDIVFLGGGSDREQKLVHNRLSEIREDFAAYVENGGVTIAICGGYQLLGKYYRIGEEKIDGLNIVDLHTDNEPGRLIGNVVIESELCEMPVVGFENHGGRTYLGEHTPFGRVLVGKGNNGKDGYEGIVYKNLIGTYLHGPLLPKNPQLCDWLLQAAISRKNLGITLTALDDSAETLANEYIVKRFAKSEIN